MTTDGTTAYRSLGYAIPARIPLEGVEGSVTKEELTTDIISLRNAGANVIVVDVAAFILLEKTLPPTGRAGASARMTYQDS